MNPQKHSNQTHSRTALRVLCAAPQARSVPSVTQSIQHLHDGGRVNYFIVGSAFARLPAGGKHRFLKFMQGDTAGFAAIIVRRDTIEIRFVDEDGRVFHKTEIK